MKTAPSVASWSGSGHPFPVWVTLPGVQRLNSTLVMKNVVIDRPYPTDWAY